MKKIYICILLIFLISPSLASASPLSLSENEILVNTETVKYDMILTFSEKPQSFEIPFFFEIENFTHRTNFGGYTCDANKTEWGSKIACNFENVTSNFGSVGLNFAAKNTFLKNVGKSYLFETASKTPLDSNKMRLKIKLQEGFVLSEKEGIPSFSPETGTQSSDGRRIYVFWEKENVKKGEGITANVVFESLQKPEPKEIDSGIFVILGVLVVIIALLVVGILFYKKSHTGMKPAIQVLKDDERKVVEILQNRQGQAKQRDIQADGDFSKATLSRLIKNLEERGVITTERMGRTNKIYLKKELGKKEPEKQKETEKSLSENQNTENRN